MFQRTHNLAQRSPERSSKLSEAISWAKRITKRSHSLSRIFAGSEANKPVFTIAFVLVAQLIYIGINDLQIGIC